ncbi:MAG TPA: aminotransferase class I/II-fold pyridoxal phosphate-dependent enzyme [Chloroflexota bacterium]|nr:aminotransferase class I/II-fold pyridoxal phosphate-dependent enzyme [Chloroflexota bacterium]
MRQPSAAVRRLQQSERAGHSAPPSPGVIPLHTGDPDFPTPPHIVEALGDAVERGYTHYPPYQGDPELRAVIADQLSKRSGLAWTADDVTITIGGSGAIFGGMAAFLDAGDQVLVPQPTFSLYGDVAASVGAEVTDVPLTDDLHLDLDALRAAAGPRARMVILCNPCNPTGVVFRRDELEALAAFCVERDLLLLADEAYDHIIFDGRQHVSALDFPELADRLLFVQTFSKTFAMTGWRLGYLAALDGMAKAALIVHRTAVSYVNAAVQRAGLVALTTPTDYPARMVEEYAHRRGMLDELLRDAEGLSWRPPEGTFYAFVKYSADMPAREMTSFLRERGVAVRSGTEYGPGGEGHIRLSFATSRDNIREGARRLAEACAEASRESKVEGRKGRSEALA